MELPAMVNEPFPVDSRLPFQKNRPSSSASVSHSTKKSSSELKWMMRSFQWHRPPWGAPRPSLTRMPAF